MVTLAPCDIEALERATLAAVPPEHSCELPGWLLGLDGGTVGRAHSAVPLHHGLPDVGVVPEMERIYAAHGLSPVWRLPQLPSFEGLQAQLAARGYRAEQATCVQMGSVQAMAALATRGRPVSVRLASAPHDAWAAVFLGEGFDAVDGAHRVRLLGRAEHAAYASAVVEGRTVAVGTASFGHGWAGVHGMRTLPAYRGQGLAAGILRAIASEAQRGGITRVFLQVEQANTAAQSLYCRAGFATAWVYQYWRKAKT